MRRFGLAVVVFSETSPNSSVKDNASGLARSTFGREASEKTSTRTSSVARGK
jgi:hypothetical protein